MPRLSVQYIPRRICWDFHIFIQMFSDQNKTLVVLDQAVSIFVRTLISFSVQRSEMHEASDGYAYVCRVDPCLIRTIISLVRQTTEFRKDEDILSIVELALPRMLPNIPEDMVPVGVTRLDTNACTYEYSLRSRTDASIRGLPAYTIPWPDQISAYFER